MVDGKIVTEISKSGDLTMVVITILCIVVTVLAVVSWALIMRQVKQIDQNQKELHQNQKRLHERMDNLNEAHYKLAGEHKARTSIKSNGCSGGGGFDSTAFGKALGEGLGKSIETVSGLMLSAATAKGEENPPRGL